MGDKPQIEEDYDVFMALTKKREMDDAFTLAHCLWCLEHFEELPNDVHLRDNLSMTDAEANYGSPAIELRQFALMLLVLFYTERAWVDPEVQLFLAEIRAYGERCLKTGADIFLLAIHHLFAARYALAAADGEGVKNSFEAFAELVASKEDPADLALIAAYGTGAGSEAFLSAARKRAWFYLNEQARYIKSLSAGKARAIDTLSPDSLAKLKGLVSEKGPADDPASVEATLELIKALLPGYVAAINSEPSALGADSKEIRELTESLDLGDLGAVAEKLEGFAAARDADRTAAWIHKTTGRIDILCTSMRDKPGELPPHLRVDDTDIEILKCGARIAPFCSLIFPWRKDGSIIPSEEDFRAWATNDLYGFLGLGMLGQKLPEAVLAEALATIETVLPKPISKEDLYRLHQLMKIVLFFNAKSP
jgi:hypothetical protein